MSVPLCCTVSTTAGSAALAAEVPPGRSAPAAKMAAIAHKSRNAAPMMTLRCLMISTPHGCGGTGRGRCPRARRRRGGENGRETPAAPRWCRASAGSEDEPYLEELERRQLAVERLRDRRAADEAERPFARRQELAGLHLRDDQVRAQLAVAEQHLAAERLLVAVEAEELDRVALLGKRRVEAGRVFIHHPDELVEQLAIVHIA